MSTLIKQINFTHNPGDTKWIYQYTADKYPLTFQIKRNTAGGAKPFTVYAKAGGG